MHPTLCTPALTAKASVLAEVELRRMSVHKNSRGLGLGALLVALVEAHARAIGATTVVLSTGSWMDLAMR